MIIKVPIVVPCTQNLTTWRDAAVLQRPRECTKYWFQACANFTKTPMSFLRPPRKITVQKMAAKVRRGYSARVCGVSLDLR